MAEVMAHACTGERKPAVNVARPGGPRALRCGEAGGIVLLVAFLLPVLVGLALAVVVIGQHAYHARKLQNAADALALAAAYSLEEHGLPYRGATDALPLATANSELVVQSTFPAPVVQAARTLVEVPVQLRASFDFGVATPLMDRVFPLRARARAQISTAVFGDVWPVVVMVLDASDSMKYPILAANGRSAFQVMQSVLTEYSALTLPVRNGLVVFNDAVTQNAAPPASNTSNAAAVGAALSGASPSGRTNATAALNAARTQVTGLTGGHNVILISDGEPTLGGACPPHAACHFDAGTAAADALRSRAQGAAAIFGVEIRRTNYATQASDFMIAVSGAPGTAGNDSTMRYLAQDTVGITMFISGLTRALCAFGPIRPGAGAAADAWRPRPVAPDLLNPRQRLYTFIRETNGNDTAVPLLADNDRDRHPTDPGFEYWRDAALGEDWIILTLATCQYLGLDGGRRVVVRWDDAQLIPF
jgi:Flp pilus assembly protein TadG